LVVSPSALDFVQGTTTLPFRITNNGAGILRWNATSNVAWATLDKNTGFIGSYGSTDVQVTVNKAGLNALSKGTISVTSAYGNATVDLSISLGVRIEPILPILP